jgi:hypothetical protein
MDPWRYRDGQWQIRWLNDHHPQGIVVCAPDRPAVALFLHGLQARQYNQLKALS